MSNLNPEENKLYSKASDLHGWHWEALSTRDPGEAARAAGARLEGGVFKLLLLGKDLTIDPSARRVGFADLATEPGFQLALVSVVYLAKAMEIEPSGRFVGFNELPGGDSFFRGPHALATGDLEKAYGRDPAGLKGAAAALGGREVEPLAGASAAMEFAALPSLPLKVLLWEETEEFGAAAKLLTDARSHLHLPLDVLWALSNLAVADLVRAGKALSP